jgi:type I restriction enzyme M protein
MSPIKLSSAPVDDLKKSKRARKAKVAAPQKLETTLWSAADKLRGHMDAAEYKHVVLGLIFLKYISDAFEEHQNKLREDIANPASELYLEKLEEREAALEDRDEYIAANIFWVPQEARWSHLRANAKQPTIGKTLDDALVAIERDNPSLKGVLPKDYARPALDKQRLGELIDLIGSIDFLPSPVGRGAGGEGAKREGEQAESSDLPSPRGRGAGGEGDVRPKGDILGRVYEYFLGQFASAEGKKGGQFYTARCVVQLLVEMLAPYKGRIFDPCCGSGGMFVQSEKFVEAHGGRIGDISVFGQESNPTTWKLAKMNLAIRGIENNLGPENADSFHRDLHKDLKADYILANPPFNDSDWGGERLREDVRWKYGVPPVSNANFAWCNTSSIISRQPDWPASCSPTAACRRINRAKGKFARASSKRIWLTAWSRCRASFSTTLRFPSAFGLSHATNAITAFAIVAAKRCS